MTIKNPTTKQLLRRKYQKTYYEKNRESILEKQREYHHEYYLRVIKPRRQSKNLTT